MASLPDYAELHCLSNFSFLRGASHPEELVAQAVARKERLGLWQFPDIPDPNAIILRQIREGAGATSGAPLPAPPPAR